MDSDPYWSDSIFKSDTVYYRAGRGSPSGGISCAGTLHSGRPSPSTEGYLMQETPGKIIPALIGALLMASLSVIGYCICFIWIILGGLLAAYLYQRKLPAGRLFLPGEGALVGWLSGLFGTLFFTLGFYIYLSIMGSASSAYWDEAGPGGFAWESIWDSLFQGILEQGIMSSLFFIFALIFHLTLFSLFSTVGGILGTAFFNTGRRTGTSQETTTT
jgi:hypothetical protein